MKSMSNSESEYAYHYLPDQALNLIAEWLKLYKQQYGALQPDWYLFPGHEPSKQRTTHLSDLKKRNAMKEWIDFTPKMLRKTISTQLQRVGAAATVTRAILNQAITSGVEKHYSHDELYHLKREWLEKWAEMLDEVKEKPAALLAEGDTEIDEDLSSAFDDIFG